MPARKRNIEESEPSTSRINKRKSVKKEDIKCRDETFKDNPLSIFRVQNIIRCFDGFQHGIVKAGEMRRLGEHIISEKLKRFYVYEVDPVGFDRRITSLQFHPKNPHILGLGSKSGQLVIRFFEPNGKTGKYVQFDGIGPGGSITSIAFSPFSSNHVFTSSIDGTVKLLNFVDSTSQVLLDTQCFTTWYCSVNASLDTGLIVTGDTSGVLKILNKDLKVIAQHRLHKKKVNSAEFCRSQGWLLATASLDNTVKLWDIRKLDAKAPLNTLKHIRPVNSAYFSLTNGRRLLTTDQHSELRVYSAPLFDLETLIPHPHRHFQHLTPIKATWHPFCDLAVVGRYPDPNWPKLEQGERTLDVISAETGTMAAQLKASTCEGIISLNSFNATGDILATGMGMFAPYWKYLPPHEFNLSAKDIPLDTKDTKDAPVPKPKRTKRSKVESKKGK